MTACAPVARLFGLAGPSFDIRSSAVIVFPGLPIVTGRWSLDLDRSADGQARTLLRAMILKDDPQAAAHGLTVLRAAPPHRPWIWESDVFTDVGLMTSCYAGVPVNALAARKG